MIYFILYLHTMSIACCITPHHPNSYFHFICHPQHVIFTVKSQTLILLGYLLFIVVLHRKMGIIIYRKTTLINRRLVKTISFLLSPTLPPPFFYLFTSLINILDSLGIQCDLGFKTAFFSPEKGTRCFGVV